MSEHPVVGPATGSKEAVLAFAQSVGAQRMDEVQAFLDELFELGDACDYDAFMIAAQSAVETGDMQVGGGWLNRWWRERLNPGAIGITGHPPQDEASHTWTNGRDSARAILVHHAAYLGTLPAPLAPFVHHDPRFQVARDFAANDPRGFVLNWEDYGNGYWAADPAYFDVIMRRVAAIRAFEGQGPQPEFVQEIGSLVAVQGAVARRRPTRESAERRQLAAGERLATDGFTDRGQEVAESARWYRLAADGAWVHSSGGAYTAGP